VERVVRPVLRHRLVVLGLPGQLLDLLVSLSHTLATHRHPFLGGFRGREALCGPAGCSRQPRKSLCAASHLESQGHGLST
jgi:hypothetical protein